jgi:hypothetical protein
MVAVRFGLSGVVLKLTCEDDQNTPYRFKWEIIDVNIGGAVCIF